jgi:hypothetical protein
MKRTSRKAVLNRYAAGLVFNSKLWLNKQISPTHRRPVNAARPKASDSLELKKVFNI